MELYDAVVKAMNIDAYPKPDVRPLGEDDVFSILLDPSRTLMDFGNINFTPIEETVRQAIEYFKKHGTLGEYTHLNFEEKK